MQAFLVREENVAKVADRDHLVANLVLSEVVEKVSNTIRDRYISGGYITTVDAVTAYVRNALGEDTDVENVLTTLRDAGVVFVTDALPTDIKEAVLSYMDNPDSWVHVMYGDEILTSVKVPVTKEEMQEYQEKLNTHVDPPSNDIPPMPTLMYNGDIVTGICSSEGISHSEYHLLVVRKVKSPRNIRVLALFDQPTARAVHSVATDAWFMEKTPDGIGAHNDNQFCILNGDI